MPIHILPPQLANQIAAGEVVERPASVVKELVENSLDAGASRIQIDIENGGASLIRIRDNGLGIPKDELGLALARHATSKIASLEDLDAILSLGFRGEALASISSVSRLTLTSRTAEQNEAWQVYAQGRDMETTIQPASHPVGTTVEVANLFFNTPARRKFLRTDKTEFAHIDEVIRRIALAKPQITFTLTHNGKAVRQYKSAVQISQKLKRVASICGDDFIKQALQIDWKHDNLHLSGWIALPGFHRSQNDLAYSYVNGRMIRDKVINHAIRQAYANYLNNEQYPAFVLYLDLDPNEVDVNVHPTKHEVRFHQARLIHDFIYQGIVNALNSEQADFAQYDIHPEKNAQVQEPQANWHISTNKPNRGAAGHNMFESASFAKQNTKTYSSTVMNDGSPRSNAFSAKFSENKPHFCSEKVSKTEQKIYAELLSSVPEKQSIQAEVKIPTEKNISKISAPVEIVSSQVVRTLALVNNKALLLQQQQHFYLLPLNKLQKLKFKLSLQQASIEKQPLLIPILFRLSESQVTRWQAQKHLFKQIGFEFTENLAQNRITLNVVPNCLRQQNLQRYVITVLENELLEISEFLTALCEQLQLAEITIFADAVNLLTEVERLTKLSGTNELSTLFIPVDFNSYLD
ncbi:DNA mismatch repair endonuclease MutL [Mannheimia massilioguelmaensis]|uniref:DNA mismatch repair endonuclease MutL n=1 Tax=Mannheimia massilioguelmaensis TaxID=1604354 RepID=UPI0005CAFFB8|nr:DNA mismatch repair endonuclease MutL [Mannheimia massilioguelmaensis]